MIVTSLKKPKYTNELSIRLVFFSSMYNLIIYLLIDFLFSEK